MISFGLMMLGSWVGGTAGILILVTALPVLIIVGCALPSWLASRALDDELATVLLLPFPVEGYELWLVSDQPLFDVWFRRPIDRALFAAAVHKVDASVSVAWVGPRTARLGIPARRVQRYEDRRTYDVGDRHAFHLVTSNSWSRSTASSQSSGSTWAGSRAAREAAPLLDVLAGRSRLTRRPGSAARPDLS